VGSQLKKLRRALPPPPSPPNRMVTVHGPGERGTARYTFTVDGRTPSADHEITVTAPPGVEMGPVTTIGPADASAPTARSEAFQPREPGMRTRTPARNTLPLLAMLALLGTGMACGGRDDG
jgi:hypothetical protein